MRTLNDYLYSGDTVLKILQRYSEDLKQSARETDNQIDLLHCNVLLQIAELLQHNEFLTSQSQRIREFYKLMANDYPFLAFTFKGRIKSLIRAESKFNGHIVEYIYDYYRKNGKYPSLMELKSNLGTSMTDTVEAGLRARRNEYQLALAFARMEALLGKPLEAKYKDQIKKRGEK